MTTHYLSMQTKLENQRQFYDKTVNHKSCYLAHKQEPNKHKTAKSAKKTFVLLSYKILR